MLSRTSLHRLARIILPICVAATSLLVTSSADANNLLAHSPTASRSGSVPAVRAGAPGPLPPGYALYAGSMSTSIQLIDIYGNPINPPLSGTYNATVQIGPPQSSTSGVTEANPFSLAIQPSPYPGPGTLNQPAQMTVLSSLPFTDPATGRDYLFQYWTYQQTGQSFSGTLTNDYASSGLALNLVNSEQPLGSGLWVPCMGDMQDASLGYPATVMQGSFSGNQVTIQIAGYAPCSNEYNQFQSTITATLISPAVDGVSPATGPTVGGTSVTISGSNFSGASAVSFGGTGASFTVNSDSSITATTPPGSAGSVDVQVTNQHGTSQMSSGDTFTYTSGGGDSSVSVSPTSLSFGNQQVETTSGAQTVTLTNGGNTPITLTGVGLAGTNPNDFGGSTTCSTTLAANGSCTAQVTFTPTTTGTRTAILRFVDSASNSPQTVDLSGTGVSSGGGGTTITIQAGAGWNMVGGSPLTLWSDSQINWSFNASTPAWYHPTGSEPAGTGAWEYVSSAGPRSVTVVACPSSVTVPVVAHRWNLVGNPCNRSVTLPGTARAYWWDQVASHYVLVTSITPGAAAWVKPASNTLTLMPAVTAAAPGRTLIQQTEARQPGHAIELPPVPALGHRAHRLRSTH